MATQTTSGSVTRWLALWLEPAPPRRFCLDLHSNPWDGVLRALGAVECGGGSFLFPLMAVSSAGPPVQPALHRSPACRPSFPFPPREIVFLSHPLLAQTHLTNTNNKHFIDEHFIGWAFEVKPHFCQLSMVPSPGFAGTRENWASLC